MKKFLLVTLIGMVVLLDVYGLVNEFLADDIETEEVVHGYQTVVYVE